MKGIKKLVALLLVLAAAISLMTVSAFAADDEAAKKELINYVYNALENSYDRDGGGTVSKTELFKQNADGVWELQEDAFAKLSSSGQQDLVNDISKFSNECNDDDKAHPDVSDKTVENWWKELQSVPGAGTKFMSLILQNTKPDYVTANKIYKPFSGIIGTIMGIIAVLGMGLLGIVMVADIFYIVIPPVRMLVTDEGTGEKRKATSRIFSNDAIYAVQVAEDSGDAQNGGKKQALGVYLKRRVPMLILLGICLMYLASGSIYVLVGKILDLVSGFLGF